MASIWKKIYGKGNKKKDLIRRLSQEIIDYKNGFDYDTIAEVVVTIGNSYVFAKDMEHSNPIHDMWREAKDLNVLDDAILKAIKEQEDRNDGNENDDDDVAPSNALEVVSL